MKIRYLARYRVSITATNYVFAGFDEQDEEVPYSASHPFVEGGFSTVAVALPFHNMSPETASWLIDDGLRDFLKHIVPTGPLILAGTSRGPLSQPAQLN